MQESSVRTILNTNIAIFPFLHNWSSNISEYFDWLSQIHESDNGKEQLINLRRHPRRTITQQLVLNRDNDYKVSSRLINYFRSFIRANQDKVVAVPIFSDQQILTEYVGNNSNVIPINTQYRDFDANGYVYLWASELSYECVKIQSLTNNQLTLVNNTRLSLLPYITKVIPARLARFSTSQTVDILTESIQYANISWNLVTETISTNRLVDGGLTSYRNYPIFNKRSDVLESSSDTFYHKIAIADTSVGFIKYDSLQRTPKSSKTIKLKTKSKLEVSNVLHFLYSLNGSVGAFWYSTFSYDLDVISLTTNTLKFRYIGYTDYRFANLTDIDILIKLNNGNEYVRRITASTVVDGGLNETVTLDSNLPSFNVNDINKVSFLNLIRIADDKATMTSITDSGVGDISFNIVETNE